MTIKSIIIDHERALSSYLSKCLRSEFPEISILGEAKNYQEACELISRVNPKLIFSDLNVFRRDARVTTGEKYEIIYTSSRSEDAISAIRQDACGFILKPFSVGNIVASVECAITKMSERMVPLSHDDSYVPDSASLPHTRLVGIPTMEGIDFLYMHEIVRCEGLQKCTRIISTRKQNFISSYNIGEFRKILEESGFFSCHKSHLINLMHVKRFTREGFIFLLDNTAIPLARRKRLEFLHQLKHL